MLFKDLQPGAEIYIIENIDGIVVNSASIVSISNPRFETLQGGALASGRVIDVTVSFDNVQKLYVIPEMLSDKVITPNGTTLICNETTLVNELKRIKTISESGIKEIDNLKLRVKKCDEYLSKYDMAYKEKQESENRLNSIEDSIKTLSEMFSQYIKKNNRKDD